MNNQITDLINKLEIIEKKHLIPGTPQAEAWFDIRFAVFAKITRSIGVYEVSHVKKKVKRNKIMRILNRVSNLVYLFWRNPFLYFFNKKPYVFYGNPRRKMEVDGKYWDIYTDPVVQVLNNKCLTIERPYGEKHYRPVRTENIAYTDGFFLLNKLISLNTKNIPKGVSNLFKAIEESINKVFEIEIEIEKMGVDRYISNAINEKLHLYLFRLLKPKIIFLVCSYGKEPIIRAAKTLKIPTIELQHGTIDKNHVGYNFSKTLPKKSFPDYFFSFGSYWTRNTQLPIATNRIYPVGFPYLEDRVKKYSQVEKENSALFISQGIIGKRLSKFACEFANNNIGAKIYYKLHPGEVLRWEKDYVELVDASNRGQITVIDGQTPSLYELFSKSKVQIGVSSTALFEGIKFGCRTYLVNLQGIEYMQGIIDEGIATLVESPGDIKVSSLENYNNDIANTIFVEDWKTNFYRGLEDILSKDNIPP